MAIFKFWKVPIGLVLLFSSTSLFAQIGILSEGACWYDSKDPIRLASFNDKTVYNGNRAKIESEVEALLGHQKNADMELFIHCGGYGSSIVAKVPTENGTFCVWTRSEKGKLMVRSIGVMNDKSIEGQLCDGHKSGEFILGVTSKEIINELQGPKWTSRIKEVRVVSDKVYRIILTKEYDVKEGEVASSLEENFTGKNAIRYIEFNEYHHPVGEFIPLK